MPSEHYAESGCRGVWLEKVRVIDDLDDLEVVERVPLQVGSDPENVEYLEAKKIVKGHFFS